ELGIVPSDLSGDEQFMRRLYLDLTGSLPKPKEVADFVADKDAGKRDKLIDRLLETPEYSYLFANKWADVLRVKRRGQPDRAAGSGRAGGKTAQVPGGVGKAQAIRQVIFNKSADSVQNKRTGATAPIQPLDGKPMEVAADEDPRQKLVDWMANKDNPFFARAV